MPTTKAVEAAGWFRLGRYPAAAICRDRQFVAFSALAMNARDFEALISGLTAQGITRAQIAERAGVSRQTLWRLSTGQGRSPYHDTVERLKRLEPQIPAVTPMKRKLR